MGFIIPQEFLEQFGNYIGEKEEATHYSTFGGSDWTLKITGNHIFYWSELSKSWRKWHLTKDHCTPIGLKEPDFRCGPPAPKKEKAIVKRVLRDSPIYTNSRIKGD